MSSGKSERSTVVPAMPPARRAVRKLGGTIAGWGDGGGCVCLVEGDIVRVVVWLALRLVGCVGDTDMDTGAKVVGTLVAMGAGE